MVFRLKIPIGAFCIKSLEIPRGGGGFCAKFQGAEIVFFLEIPRGGMANFGLNSRERRYVFCLEIPRGV